MSKLILENKKFGVFFLAAVILFSLFFLAGPAKAAVTTTTNGDFQITSNDPLFSISNAAPGQVFTSDFTVTNLGSGTEKLQMKLDIKTNPGALADFLSLKIEDKDLGICLLGCGPDLKVSDANGLEIIFNSIGGGKTKNYSFVLTFSSLADNEFQNANMTFDITLGYKGSDEDEDDGDGGNGGGGGGGGGAALALARRTVTTAPGAGPQAGQTPPGEIKGEEINPEISGVEICKSWPLWMWILILIGYFFVFNFNNLYRYREDKKVRWFWEATYTAITLAIWYYFDKCRNFEWFPIIVAIVGILSYWYYLKKFRERIKTIQPPLPL